MSGQEVNVFYQFILFNSFDSETVVTIFIPVFSSIYIQKIKV